jgi:hypothetical protein
VSLPTVAGTAVEGTPFREAQVDLTPTFSNSYYMFSLSGGNTPTNVYTNGTLTVPFPNTGRVTSDAYGRYPPIYLDPSIIYRVRFFNSSGVQQWQSDPYYSTLSTVGTSSLSAYGLQIAPTGEFTLEEPNTGGTGVTLTVSAGALGTAALEVTGTLPGNSAIIVNNSATAGAQTATFTASNKPGTATSSPAGWLPITCDGVQYYTPIWHGNNFTPYTPNPSAVGEVINAMSVTFNGNGTTTATGGSASPGNWFSPATAGIGAGYYIKITKTGGLSGVQFSAANGSYANITSGGITISSNAGAAITGTYTLSSSGSGSPIVASGTITLSGNSGVQGASYNGAANLIFAGNGTTTLNGASASSWYTPTTANVGAGYYLLISQTGGTPGYSFSAATGAYTNITSGGLSIGISGSGATTYNVTGTYQISSNSAGTAVLGSGTITLAGGFTPATHLYTSGTSATETVPAGASHCYIEVLGAGGSGNSNASNAVFGACGGGGGLAVLSGINVTAGNTFTYNVGAGGAGVFNNAQGNGGATSSVTGTVAGGSVSLSVTGGTGGVYGSGIAFGGLGGTATGGTTNTTGNSGGTLSGGAGGSGISGSYVTGGAGGASNNTSGANGGAGGSYGAGGGAATNNGTTGTSGAGSGGQIAFHYT